MKVARLKKRDEKAKNHHPGLFQYMDSALCGQDLIGDYEWKRAKLIEGKITCRECLIIIKACQKLQKGIDF